MRELAAPHQGHRFSSVDTLALWRCDEGSAAAFADEAGNYTTTAGTLPPVAPSLFGAPAGTTGARDFDGSTHYATAPGDAASDLVLYPTSTGGVPDSEGYTVEAWIDSDSDVAEQTIASYGTTGQTAFSFRKNAQKLKLTYHVTGTPFAVETTDDVVSTGVHHVALVVRKIGNFIDVEFFVDGHMVERFEGEAAAAGAGGSPVFCIGRHHDTAVATAYFNGRIDDLRVSAFAASAACVRDSYARGVRRFDVETMQASKTHETHLYVYAEWPAQTDPALIDRGVGYADLSDLLGHDHVIDADGGEDVDDIGQNATVRLRRQAFRQNIAPGYDFGPLSDNGFLQLTRRMKIEVACVPKGYGREAARVFRQPVHEGIIARVSWPTGVMTLTVPDRIAFLARTWCEEDSNGDDYIFSPDSDESIEDVCQQILDTFQPAGGYKVDDNDDGRFVLWAPEPLTFNMNAFYVPSTQSVQAKLEEIATVAQARIRMRWDDHRQCYRLCLYRPDRAATWSSGMPELTARDVIDIETLELADDDIRNVVDVEYGDTGDNDNTDQPIRKKATVSSATSIALYGRRYCKVGLGTNNPLNDSTGAGALATAVSSDLALPKAQEKRATLFRADIELEDMVRLQPDGLTWSGVEDRACTGWEWSIGEKEARSSFSLRGANPSGGVKRWFDWGIVRKGWRPGLGKGRVTAPGAPTLAPLAGGLDIVWAPPVGKINRRYLETEVHVSTGGSGFTPDSSSLKSVVRGGRAFVPDLSAEDTYWVKLIHRDAMGNVTLAGASSSATPRYLPKAPGMWASRSADYNPGSGKVPIQFDTVDGDHFGDYDDTTYVFTANRPGFYSFAAGVRCTDTSPFDVDLLLEVYDGVGVFASASDNIAGTDASARVDLTVWLRAGEEVTANILKNTATANFLAKTDGKTYFAVRYHAGRE